MKRLWPVWTIASALAAIALAWALAARAGLDLPHVKAAVAGLRLGPFAVLAMLVALSTWMSAERWRAICRRSPVWAEGPAHAYTLTAVGVALGQVLPVQVATALARGAGMRLFGDGRPLRAAGATVYEQAFDFALVAALAVASVLAVLRRDPWLFPPAALLAAATAGAIVLGAAKALHGSGGGPLWTAPLREAANPALVRRLATLSGGRFLILVAMAAATTACTGLPVPVIALAAALPLVALATAVPITPAGIGVNEWAFAGVLTAFGVPLATAAQWALLNRLLVAAASLLVGFAAVLVSAAPRIRRPSAASSWRTR